MFIDETIFKYLLAFTFLTLYSCENRDTQILDFGAFSLESPADWEKFRIKGIDSYVGGITNKVDTLIFDYGAYSYSFVNQNDTNQILVKDTIYGKVAYYTEPILKGEGYTGIYIENASNGNKFNMIGHQIKNEKAVLSIFSSLKFKDTDPSLVRREINLSNANYPTAGRKIFVAKCNTCHAKGYELTGPDISMISKDSLEYWLTPEKRDQKDTSKMGLNYHRSILSKRLTQEEMASLIEFLNM